MKARELVEAKDKALVCPIGMELMCDPVVAADGFTYERRDIEKHFETHRRGEGLWLYDDDDFDDNEIPPLVELEAIHDTRCCTFYLEAACVPLGGNAIRNTCVANGVARRD